MGDFKNAYAASKEPIEKTDKRTGEFIERMVSTPPLCLASPKRHTVATRTFRPGHGTFTTDPGGLPAVNTWKPYVRDDPSAHYEQHVAAFEGHIRDLWGEEADGTLDWFAHVEQPPGVLPHGALLHVSTQTGTGRNMVAGVLARLWRGQVRASFNLVSSLRSGFNGEPSGKLLSIVEELREGARADQWEHSETIKKLITEERRTINFKYGQQRLEPRPVALMRDLAGSAEMVGGVWRP